MIVLRLFVLLMLPLIIANELRAQSADSSANVVLEQKKFLTLVNANREQSYITFGSGIGNLEPLIFEGKLSPSYFFTGKQRSWAFMMNPQVTIRMLDKKSQPIRNPSYKVYLTYYKEIKFWEKSFLRKIFYDNAIVFASLAHHSNGQDGSFYVSDSTKEVNTENGNFSTNFLEFGVSAYQIKEFDKDYFSIREVRAWMEVHPPGWSAEELDNLYGYFRMYGKVGLVGPTKRRENDGVNRWLQHSSLELKSGWIFGKMDGASPFDFYKRFVLDVTYKYYPTWFDEIAFFLRFYQGQDYYNIYFVNEPLTQLSIGITSNIMSFKQTAKTLSTKTIRN
ncbi:hypothetical protein WBG78_24795 [Chryseolinea sp. T2]|uniref:hypothetical protein n=1 Tax=Chryseolinea sp. T2 TaxID=3129255 RepID=UPI0030783680